MRRPDTLLHPVRMRIVQCIAAQGAMSPKSLQEALVDVPPATLYRHVKALFEAGFLEVASERRARGAVERTYRLVGGHAVLGPEELEFPDHEEPTSKRSVTGDDHLRWFSGFTATLVDAFARYTRRRRPDLVRDRVRYRLVPMHLTETEATQFAEELEALYVRYHERGPGPGRVRRWFGFVTLPDA